MAGTRGAIRGVARQHQAESLTIDFVHFVRNVVRAVLDPYRPELHYMRGPGPKWREKHPLGEPPMRIDGANRVVSGH